jgi:hypothetical protein
MAEMAKKITEYVLIGFTADQIKRIREEAKAQKISVTAVVRSAADRYVLTKRAERSVSVK